MALGGGPGLKRSFTGSTEKTGITGKVGRKRKENPGKKEKSPAKQDD